MPRTGQFDKRIGAVVLPQADPIDAASDLTPAPEGPLPIPGVPIPFPTVPFPPLPAPDPGPTLPFPKPPPFKFCFTHLRPGCYTIGFVPALTPLFGTRYRGTLRVTTDPKLTISGDLYSYRLFDVFTHPEVLTLPNQPLLKQTDEAADTGGTIPIYSRRSYHSYLKGTGAQLVTLGTYGTECTFSLSFDEFVYNQPATGFKGTFNTAPTRSIVVRLSHTSTPDLYTGSAFQGTTNLGAFSMRWVSDSVRRAQIEIHTLNGATTPPANVGGTTMSSIFAAIGWDVSVTDMGGFALPAALAGVNPNACWSTLNLHTLMASLADYNPAELDSTWKVHLVAVPAMLGCSRGIMFDTASGDPNNVAREGSATFSDDGYPAGEVPDGQGGSHYDAAANQMQKNVPRAFLRSATHEIGHAFNQIHQNFEAGLDNSIMSPTPSVAEVLGLPGTFPDQINLAFNAVVTAHLRHLPDPAVRPGGMDFFGAAVSAPQAADVAWLDGLTVTVVPSERRMSLGQPITLRWTLTNAGDAEVPVPADLGAQSLHARVSVTDPAGNVTFMRPPDIDSCPSLKYATLAKDESVDGGTTLYWGTDGFAFEKPGRHRIEVICLWDIAGVPVGASGEEYVFVTYPSTPDDNEIAAQLLHPDVGLAVATGDADAFEIAKDRIAKAASVSSDHPAVEGLRSIGLLRSKTKGGKRRSS
jgi:hypothetical protein